MKRSGRTTRMIARAMSIAAQGRPVLVIAANETQRRQFQATCGDSVEVTTGQNFDWEQMRPIGGNPDCVSLVDHSAIESRFGEMLKMLHRFDLPECPPVSLEHAMIARY